MDAKYLAEIKAREQAVTPGPWKVGISALITDANGHALFFGEDAKGNADFIAHARTDIPALISEVEQMTKQFEEWRTTYIRMKEQWKHDCDLLVQAGNDNAAKDQQIATLKKALELAVESSQNAFIQLANAGVLTIKHIGSVKENFEYWIQQAQEQEATT